MEGVEFAGFWLEGYDLLTTWIWDAVPDIRSGCGGCGGAKNLHNNKFSKKYTRK